MSTLLNLSLFMMASLLSVSSQAEPSAQAEKVFSTTQSLGFDKQISIWLVEKYITPKTPVVFFTGNTPPAGTRVFDEGNAEFSRTADRSSYEQLVSQFAPNVGSLNYFKKIVFDIEINLWLPDELPDSLHVERAFRSLQERWGREYVPHTCYKEFFDAIENLYEVDKNLKNAVSINEKLVCWKGALNKQMGDPNVMVPQIPIPALLGSIRSGAKVAFVDVREPNEFAENHIPGAVNMLIKDANQSSVAVFKKFDIVVAYCIKDFRGFEMARKLKSLGVSQAVILDPFGIKGWIDSKLPVYQLNKISDQQAAALFQTCINKPSDCKAQ